MFKFLFPTLQNITDILDYFERCQNIPSTNAYDLIRKDLIK